MQYIQIGQDIVDAIKGGAGYSGQSESEEIVGYISEFGSSFSEIIKVIVDFVKEFLAAIKK